MKFGDRVLLKQFKNGNKLWGTVTRCDKCGGTGKVIWTYADHVCFDCDGKGWYYDEERELTPENEAKREALTAKKRAKWEAERAQREAEQAQREAEWKAQQEERERIRRGHYFGEIGQKIEIEVTYKGCAAYETVYGWMNIYRFDTSDGAHMIWRTSAELGGHDWFIDPDDKITIRATIKDHKEYHGIEQTELTRLKVVKAVHKMRQLTREELIEAEENQRKMTEEEYDSWRKAVWASEPKA